MSLDVQAVRTEEKRAAAKEIESLRNYYTEREKQTSDDLLEIEKLHADRYRDRYSLAVLSSSSYLDSIPSHRVLCHRVLLSLDMPFYSF